MFGPGVRKFLFISLAALTMALAAIAVFDSEAGLLQVLALKKQHEQLTDEVKELEGRKEFLKDRVEKVESGDTLVLEEVAREKNLIRPGDTVYRVHYQTEAGSDSLR